MGIYFVYHYRIRNWEEIDYKSSWPTYLFGTTICLQESDKALRHEEGTAIAKDQNN